MLEAWDQFQVPRGLLCMTRGDQGNSPPRKVFFCFKNGQNKTRLDGIIGDKKYGNARLVVFMLGEGMALGAHRKALYSEKSHTGVRWPRLRVILQQALGERRKKLPCGCQLCLPPGLQP